MANTAKAQSDVFIIGGGISGAAMAAECSRRGLKVMLCDQQDVGGTSSSRSDQIIPGALHFLRHHNVPYFNKVIKEKTLLKQQAPHLFTERPFVIIPDAATRVSSVSRIWLWLFQHWLQGNRNHSLAKRTASEYQLAPLQATARAPWVMQECMVDDARLVIENLLEAHQHDASIQPHHRFIGAKRQQGLWQITLQTPSGRVMTLHSRCLINASGAQVQQVQKHIEGIESRCWIELKRKLFLMIPKFYRGDQAYLIESGHAPISVTPHLDHYCLISTTLGIDNEQGVAASEEQEISDLLIRLNQHFSITLSREAVIRHYQVQQPFYSDHCSDAADGVDDYALDYNCNDGRSPMISVFGGSFATHRAMAQEAVELLAQHLSLQVAPQDKPLPGGDMEPATFDQFILKVASHYPWLPSHLLQHYCRTYGARCLDLLGDARTLTDLGDELCPGLHQQEAEFLVQTEWASSAEDILWRRTRLGLHTTEEDCARLQNWLDGFLRSPSSSRGYTMSNSLSASGRTH